MGKGNRNNNQGLSEKQKDAIFAGVMDRLSTVIVDNKEIDDSNEAQSPMVHTRALKQ